MFRFLIFCLWPPFDFVVNFPQHRFDFTHLLHCWSPTSTKETSTWDCTPFPRLLQCLSDVDEWPFSFFWSWNSFVRNWDAGDSCSVPWQGVDLEWKPHLLSIRFDNGTCAELFVLCTFPFVLFQSRKVVSLRFRSFKWLKIWIFFLNRTVAQRNRIGTECSQPIPIAAVEQTHLSDFASCDS